MRSARLNVISKIADLAAQNDVLHVVVAGDVWDQQIPAEQTIRQPLDIMGKAAQITWWLLPGNHDPARENGLWDRIVSMGCPDNVKLMLVPQPYEVQPGVFFLPAPWVSKNPGTDNTIWMDTADLPDEAIRIGVAHGSMRDFGGDASQKCTISVFDRIKDARLDYLALGDWHGCMAIHERIHYPGTPEADLFASKDPGWILLVTLSAAGAAPKVEPLRTAEHHWVSHSIEVFPGSQLSDILTPLMDAHIPAHKTLLRVSFKGELPVDEYSAFRAAIADVKASYAYFEADLSELHPLLSVDDLDDLDLAGSLRMSAEALLAQKDNPDATPHEAGIAARALDLLLTYSRREPAP